jgi:hypothetical protein
MFLRSSVVKKGGKTYRYWKLVENVRTDTGPRQQVVAHLGDLSNFAATDWQALARRMGEPEMAAALERRVRQGGRQGRPPKWTLEDRSASASDASDLVSIRLSETSWREPVAFGDVYTALVLWKRLGLGELLGECMSDSVAKVPWSAVAALMAVNRLVEPMPEWPRCAGGNGPPCHSYWEFRWQPSTTTVSTAAWIWCCPTSKPLRSALPVWDRAYSDNPIGIYYTI